jgi:outer membrane protein assembly factor BamB
MRSLLRLLCFTGSLIAAVTAHAGDWPQILGPNRNGVAQDETLADAWPKSGPKQLWETPVGSGYAGVAIAGKTLIVFDRHDDSETVTARDAETGDELWRKTYPSTYRPQIEDSDGPRCVPVIADGRAFTFGAEGVLSAWELTTGKPLWSRKTHAEFNPPDAYFGAGSTPVVDGKRLLVNVGGRAKEGIVAFDTATGKVLWTSTNDAASYSSPIVVTVNDVEHALFITRLHFVSLDPATGEERFRTAFGARGPTVNGANPVMIGDAALLTASYGVGAKLVRIGRTALRSSGKMSRCSPANTRRRLSRTAWCMA